MYAAFKKILGSKSHYGKKHSIKKLVVFGDSLTDDYWKGFNSGKIPNPNGHWSHIVAKELGVPMANHGIAGDTAYRCAVKPDGNTRIADAIAENPSHALVMMGGNDIYNGYTTSQIIGYLQTICQSFKNAGIETILMWCPIGVYSGGSVSVATQQSEISSMAGLVSDLASSLGINFIDFDGTDIGSGYTTNPTYHLPDLIHPNTTGHCIMAQFLLPKLMDLYAYYGSATVTVSCSDSSFISGRIITISSATKSYSEKTVNSGKAYFPSILPGSYTVSCDVPNGVTLDASQNVIIKKGIESNINLNLTSIYGKISISVSCSDTSKKSGRTITATDGINTYTGTTDINGVATISNITPGTYTVSCDVPSETTLSSTKTATVIAGNTTSVSLTLVSVYGSLAVTVASSDSSYISNRIITATDGTNIYTGTTNSSGYVLISSVLAGTYTVSCDVPSDATLDASVQAVISVENTTTCNLQLTSIYGTASITISCNDSSYVLGRTVNITNESNSYSGTTNSAGYVSMRILPGTYTVSCDAPDGTTLSGTSNITVTAGGSSSASLTLTVNPVYGTAEITVSCSDATAKTGRTITITDGTNTYTGTTNSSGIATISSILVGTYTYTCDVPSGYTLSVNGNITITKNTTSTATLTLTAAISDELTSFVITTTTANQLIESFRHPSYTYDTSKFTIDWGDGTINTAETHTYASAGLHTVKITGDFPALYFYNLTDRTVITELKNMSKYIKTFNGAFMQCAGITSIPVGLFNNCTTVTDFTNAFRGTKVASIPAGLFDKCTLATTFIGTFMQNTSLVTIPDGLFNNCPLATNFTSLFYGCSGITSISTDIFSSCINARIFRAAFSGCSKLKTIPIDLMTKCTGTTDFANAFYNCTAITSNVPALWNITTATVYSQCFFNCTSAANYSSIPSDWK